MAWRESIEVPPVKHGQTPIPFATKVGNMLFTGGIFGANPDKIGRASCRERV